MSRSRSSRRSLALRAVPALVVGIFLHGLVIALIVGRSDTAPRDKAAEPARQRAERTTTDNSTVGPPPPGPSRTVAGVPAGFARTRDGAVAAATSFVATAPVLVDLDPLAAEAAVRQMAATATADRQVTATLDALRYLRDQLALGEGPIAYREAAIAYRLEAWSARRARVAAWSVAVLARAGVAPPQAFWAISTLELIWERGDWKVWAETTTPGPAPIPADSAPPATAAELARALDGFRDVGQRR